MTTATQRLAPSPVSIRSAGNNPSRSQNRKLLFLLPCLLIPGLCFCVGAYAQITPSADAYTNTADPTTNYGAGTLLYVNGATEAAYIQFNLASIPSGASVSQATLKLYVNGVTTAGSFNVDYANGSWLESKIDASDAPPPGTTIASSVSVTAADKNQYILVNITSAVEAWLKGSETNNGIILVANSSFNATFDSKENTTTSHPAELDIAYASAKGGGTLTGVTTASGSGLSGGGTSGTLNLSLTKACGSNQVLQWNGSVWTCSSAGTGTITGITAGTDLTGGGSGGNVTLNLNTSNVPQLSAANAFSALNTFPNVGIGTGNPIANLDVVGGGGLHILVGDPGCGTYAAIGFLTTPLSGCKNYALLGDGSGGTYINASGASSTIHFRINNNDVMGIFSNGLVGIGTGSPQAALEVQTTTEQDAGWFQSSAADIATLGAINTAPPQDNGFSFVAGNGEVDAYCDFDQNGDFHCTGSKSAVVPVDGGSRKVALYAVEAPENWFEDYGSGVLSNGSARVDLEPTFAKTVNTDLDYHVFVTPNDDCKGLYVSQKSPTSFEVHELGGGTSSVAFDYRIIAKRKNYENVRLADLTERYKKLNGQLAKMRQRKQSAVPSSPATMEQKPATRPMKGQARLTQSTALAHGGTK